MSIHAKIKILKWDEVMVHRIHNNGDTQIAQELLENGARFFEDKSDKSINDENILKEEVNLSHINEESDQGNMDKNEKNED